MSAVTNGSGAQDDREEAGVGAFEQGLEVGKSLRDGGQIDAGIAGGIHGHHRVAHARRILDVDPVGHVVLV